VGRAFRHLRQAQQALQYRADCEELRQQLNMDNVIEKVDKEQIRA